MKNNHPVFTKEMIKTHTILIPSMLDIHFKLLSHTLTNHGYKNEILQNESSSVIEEGLKYVHNDTCYPATLVIGQFLDALKKRDDLNTIALLITQTGGGCRASNYIHLLRKALIKAGYGYIPVISLAWTGSIEESGFKLTLGMARELIASFFYGDILMYLYNKTRSYEIISGSSYALVQKWIDDLSAQIAQKKGLSNRSLRKNFAKICESFDNLDINITPKPKVGIVGEIYVKYARLGNNDLDNFLVKENCEVLVPGLVGFINYCLYNMVYDIDIYGGSKSKTFIFKILIKYIAKREKWMINAIKNTKFEPMEPFAHTKDLSLGIIDHGSKMGEGWLLTAEMVELVQIGYQNIVCAQPFGCLPNHIAGKGVMKTIKMKYPSANIVAIDYDPSATRVNQENRIKLMLAIAREEIKISQTK